MRNLLNTDFKKLNLSETTVLLNKISDILMADILNDKLLGEDKDALLKLYQDVCNQFPRMNLFTYLALPEDRRPSKIRHMPTAGRAANLEIIDVYEPYWTVTVGGSQNHWCNHGGTEVVVVEW